MNYFKFLLKILLLKLAVQLIYSFKVNVKEHPEYLSEDGKVCNRNCEIAKTALYLDGLIAYLEYDSDLK